MFRSIALLLTTVAACALVTSSAHAAGNPYSPQGVCGPGYGVVDHHDLKGPKGGVLATAYLLWSDRTGKNCSVTLKRREIGTPSWVETSIARPATKGKDNGSGYKAQDGFFKYYAGPLYVAARHRCVIFGGRVRMNAGQGDSWITPQPVHCG